MNYSMPSNPGILIPLIIYVLITVSLQYQIVKNCFDEDFHHDFKKRYPRRNIIFDSILTFLGTPFWPIFFLWIMVNYFLLPKKLREKWNDNNFS